MSWFDWTLVEKHADVRRFVSLLAARRLMRDMEHEHRRIDLTTFLQQANKAWHGTKLDQPDWGDNSQSVALTGEIRKEGLFFHLILNAYWQPLEFELPKLEGGDLASMDRHRARIAKRHCPMGRIAARSRRPLSCRRPFGSHALHD